MNRGNALITTGGILLIGFVTCGSGFLIQNAVNDLHAQQGESFAMTSSYYEDRYDEALNTQLVNTVSDNDDSSESSVVNVTITHNDEVVSTVVVKPEETVSVDVTVDDNDDVSVVVTNPDSSDDNTGDDDDTSPISDVTETLPDGTVVYHIQWGDTLCEISTLLGYSVDELAEYNHIKDVNLIYAGSVLRVPNWESPP